MNSIFGWLLSGPVSHPSTDSTFHSLGVVGKDQYKSKCPQIDCLVQMLKCFWDNESVGICDATAGERSIPFLPEIQFDGIRYEIKLPWKEDYLSQDIPDHFHLCFNRLKYLQQRLLKTPNILQEYNQIIREQLDQGIIEVIVDPNNTGTSHLHYLPHHAVIHRLVENLQHGQITTAPSIIDHYVQRPSTPTFNDITLLNFARAYTMPKKYLLNPLIRENM